LLINFSIILSCIIQVKSATNQILDNLVSHEGLSDYDNNLNQNPPEIENDYTDESSEPIKNLNLKFLLVKLRNRVRVKSEVTYDGLQNGLDEASEKTKRSVKRLRMAVCGNMNGKPRHRWMCW